MTTVQSHVHLQLASIISSAVQDLTHLSDQEGVPLPSLYNVTSWTTDPGEALLSSPSAQEAAGKIRAACGMLMALVQTPYIGLQEATWSFHISSCIRVAVESKSAEIIRAIGTKDGVHVNDIAALNGIDPSKLGRVLRTLATCYIFQETSPGVFANNRLSAPLDSGAQIDPKVSPGDILRLAPNSIGAVIGHCTDDVMVSSTGLSRNLLSPKTASAQSPHETPFNVGWNRKEDFWGWLELRNNEARKERFAIAMGVGKYMKGTLEGFDWNTLPAESTIIDVGGGTGSALMPMIKEHDGYKLVIQDRPKVLTVSREVWKSEYPQAIEKQQVTFQDHDFFEPQPVKGATVYYLRHILHDWAHDYAARILRRVRDAASMESTLVIVDTVINYAMVSGPPKEGDMNSKGPDTSMLLANRGNMTPYLKDLNILTLCNGGERTSLDWEAILKSTGWRIVKIYQGPVLAEIVAAPEPLAEEDAGKQEVNKPRGKIAAILSHLPHSFHTSTTS